MVTVTVYVPKKALFALVGRSGSTVRAIQSQHGVKVSLPPASSPSTAVTVSGSEEGVAAARQTMREKLGFEPSDVPLRRAELAVPRRDHSQLIGKGGAVVRGLESRFGCNVHIPRRQDRNSNVLVEGPPDRVAELLAEISRVLGYEVRVVSGDGSEAKEGEDGSAAAAAAEPQVDYSRPINETLFFPDNDGDDGWNFDRFLAYLRSATESIDVCVFTLSENTIRDILREHQRNGVKVRLLTDNATMENKGSDTAALAKDGIAVKADVSDHHMHHKFAVIDGKLLINGSFNWTFSASRGNAENVMITTHRAFVEDFKAEFERMWADDKAFTTVE